MFSLFIVSLSFSKSLTTKGMFLDDKECMVRTTIIDMSPNELKH